MRLAAAAGTFAVFVAACSSSSKSTGSAGSSTPAATSATATAPAASASAPSASSAPAASPATSAAASPVTSAGPVPSPTAPAPTSGTVSIDVGGGKKVTITLPLTIGVFVPGQANRYGQVQWAAAQSEAAKFGVKVVMYDSNYSSTTQLQQAQTALQQGKINAAVAQPNDPGVVCNIFGTQFPAKNILVTENVVPICDQGENQGGTNPQDLWLPGQLNMVGS